VTRFRARVSFADLCLPQSKEKATELADAERKVREAEQRNGVMGAEAEGESTCSFLIREPTLIGPTSDSDCRRDATQARERARAEEEGLGSSSVLLGAARRTLLDLSMSNS